MRNIKILLLLIIFLQALSIVAQNKTEDSTITKKWTLKGYVKDLPSAIFTKIDQKWITSNLIHNRLDFNWYINPALKFSFSDRNRLYFGELLKDIPGYDKSFEDDNGVFKLSKNIYSNRSFVLNSTIDRVYIDYTRDKLEITFGRQRINWGQTFVWNPNDIFNTYSYFDFDYEEKPGSDAIRAQYYINSTDKFELAAKENKDRKLTIAGLYKFNKWKYDIQFLGGILNEKYFVIGTGWSGEIAKGGFRGELSYFIPKNISNDSSGIFVGSVGYDYTFKNSLMLQSEVLYNGNKNDLKSALTGFENQGISLSPINPFLSGFSYFISTSYPFTPLLNGSLALIYNPQFKMYFIIPQLSYSLADNLDISAITQSFKSFQNTVVPINSNYLFLRLKWSF